MNLYKKYYPQNINLGIGYMPIERATFFHFLNEYNFFFSSRLTLIQKTHDTKIIQDVI